MKNKPRFCLALGCLSIWGFMAYVGTELLREKRS
jgi:hypothetical protein